MVQNQDNLSNGASIRGTGWRLLGKVRKSPVVVLSQTELNRAGTGLN